MNLKQLSRKVASKIKMKKNKAEAVIEAVLESITEALHTGEKVRLVGFGNFVVRTRKGRTGRNPRTGEPIKIESSKGPAFVPGINLKKAIKGPDGIGAGKA